MSFPLRDAQRSLHGFSVEWEVVRESFRSCEYRQCEGRNQRTNRKRNEPSKMTRD